MPAAIPEPGVSHETPYMSRIPDRRPEYKAHVKLGQAKNAINYRVYEGTNCDMEIYEWQNGEWVLLYSVKAGDTEVPWRRENLKEVRAAAKKRRENEEQARMDNAREVASKRWEEATLHWFEGTREDFIEAFMEGYRYKD